MSNAIFYRHEWKAVMRMSLAGLIISAYDQGRLRSNWLPFASTHSYTCRWVHHFLTTGSIMRWSSSSQPWCTHTA